MRGRAGQDIHHILHEAILLAEPRASPGAAERRGQDTTGQVHLGGWMGGSWDKLWPEQAGVRMRRGLGAPGPGYSRRPGPSGTRRHSRCQATASRPARARPTVTRGRPRAPIGCLRKAHGSHWASAASAAFSLAHRPLPTPRHFLTPFPPPAPPAARRERAGTRGDRGCDWRRALPLRPPTGRRAVQLLKGTARSPEAGAVLSACGAAAGATTGATSGTTPGAITSDR